MPLSVFLYIVLSFSDSYVFAADPQVYEFSALESLPLEVGEEVLYLISTNHFTGTVRKCKVVEPVVFGGFLQRPKERLVKIDCEVPEISNEIFCLMDVVTDKYVCAAESENNRVKKVSATDLFKRQGCFSGGLCAGHRVVNGDGKFNLIEGIQVGKSGTPTYLVAGKIFGGATHSVDELYPTFAFPSEKSVQNLNSINRTLQFPAEKIKAVACNLKLVNPGYGVVKSNFGNGKALVINYGNWDQHGDILETLLHLDKNGNLKDSGLSVQIAGSYLLNLNFAEKLPVENVQYNIKTKTLILNTTFDGVRITITQVLDFVYDKRVYEGKEFSLKEVTVSYDGRTELYQHCSDYPNTISAEMAAREKSAYSAHYFPHGGYKGNGGNGVGGFN